MIFSKILGTFWERLEHARQDGSSRIQNTGMTAKVDVDLLWLLHNGIAVLGNMILDRSNILEAKLDTLNDILSWISSQEQIALSITKIEKQKTLGLGVILYLININLGHLDRMIFFGIGHLAEFQTQQQSQDTIAIIPHVLFLQESDIFFVNGINNLALVHRQTAPSRRKDLHVQEFFLRNGFWQACLQSRFNGSLDKGPDTRPRQQGVNILISIVDFTLEDIESHLEFGWKGGSNLVVLGGQFPFQSLLELVVGFKRGPTGGSNNVLDIGTQLLGSSHKELRKTGIVRHLLAIKVHAIGRTNSLAGTTSSQQQDSSTSFHHISFFSCQSQLWYPRCTGQFIDIFERYLVDFHWCISKWIQNGFPFNGIASRSERIFILDQFISRRQSSMLAIL
mmetsp:Transcript_31367/g.75582  ORF Transcript_31367/g.75582 Transcript_31367/m.75582 type:complete len:394 (+) Transcript_31367:3252-4433(+)